MNLFNDLHSAGFTAFQNKTRAAQFELVHKKTVEYSKQFTQVLDWGCGNGHFSYFLLSLGLNVTGYTIFDNGELCDEIKEKWPHSFLYTVHHDPEKLPFSDSTFDAVFSIGVLEHVRETGGTEIDSLIEIRRILKPNGSFFCFHLPQKASWIEYCARIFSNKNKYRHNYLYSKQDIEVLLQRSGLSLTEISSYNFMPYNTLSVLPTQITNNSIFYTLYRCIDNALTFICPSLAQNLFFVAQKR